MIRPVFIYAGSIVVLVAAGQLAPVPTEEHVVAAASGADRQVAQLAVIEIASFDASQVPAARPPAPEVVVEPSPPDPAPADIFLDVAVLAIAVTDDGAVALIRAGQETRTLRFGSVFRDYVVSDVTGRSVLLTAGDETYTLALPPAEEFAP